MGDLYNKANAPYLIAGALATLVLLASGTLAVAPYVKCLSSIAAFNVALPVALSLSILSTLILALSCKMISNNKKIEVEKNKFAEKEQELKQQLKSKVQELENEITLGKEAASKEVEELNNQLNRLTREKQDLEKEVIELKAKVKAQLKHKEEMLSLEYQELRDENTRLKDEKGNLQGELCETKDKLSNLVDEYDDLYGVCSLGYQHAVLEEKARQLELALQEKIEKIRQLSVQLRKKEEEISSLEGSLKDSKEREEELSKKAKRLKERLDSKTQEAEKLAAEKEELFGQLQKEELNRDEIKSLKEHLHQKEKEVSKLQDDKSELESSKKDLYNEYEKLTEHNSALKSKVQHLQETVNQSEMQNESSHSALLDISSEHLSELEGTGENKLANGLTFPKPLSPRTSTPRSTTVRML